MFDFLPLVEVERTSLWEFDISASIFQVSGLLELSFRTVDAPDTISAFLQPGPSILVYQFDSAEFC
jgi:hypothetical protein